MAKIINKTAKGYDHYITVEGVYSPRIDTPKAEAMPPGIYTLQHDQNNNIYFVPMQSMTDQLIRLPDTASDRVVNEIRTFWSGATKSKFDDYGLVYKRGILLYGAPGTGKTCTIATVMEQVVADGGIVLFNPGASLLAEAVNRLREIQPNMKVLAVFEEFDGICDSSSFLSLLDGEMQLENIVYVATTNYINRIPDRIKNRPSRFATVIEIGAPNADARRVYLEHKLKGAERERIDAWVAISEGMVLDQIKDLIVSVYCMDASLEDAADKIKKMGNLADNSEDDDYDDEDESPANLLQKAINTMVQATGTAKIRTAR